jgi:hypothetical protein
VQGLKSDIAILHIDSEDSAFHFSAAETFAKQGDRDLRRSDEAMCDKDLKLALHLARDSTRAYDKGRAQRRLVVAEKVEHQLVAAISARQDAHGSRISEVLRHAEEVNAAAAESEAHLSFKVKRELGEYINSGVGVMRDEELELEDVKALRKPN